MSVMLNTFLKQGFAPYNFFQTFSNIDFISLYLLNLLLNIRQIPALLGALVQRLCTLLNLSTTETILDPTLGESCYCSLKVLDTITVIHARSLYIRLDLPQYRNMSKKCQKRCCFKNI